MARAFQERIQGNVQVPSTGETAALNGSVSPIATPTYVPGSNPLLDIAEGLKSLNPGLAKISQDQVEKDRRQAILDAKAQAERNAIDKEKMDLAQPDLTNVPFAVRSDFSMAYKESISNKLGAEAKQELFTRYDAEHTQPDFNFGKFIQDFKAKELAGVTDSQFVVGLGAHIENASEHLAARHREFTQKKVYAEATSNLSVELGEITPAASPEENWIIYNRNAEKYAPLGITRADVAAMAFEKAKALSVAQGGDPRVFEMFEQIDPVTGKTPIDMNPKLADNVAQAKREAQSQYEQTMQKANFSTSAEVRLAHDNALETGKLDDMSFADVADMVRQHMGPTGVYRSEGDLSQFMHRWIKRQESKGVLDMAPRMAAAGTLHMVPEKEQKAFLAQALATPYARLQEALAIGGTGQVAEPVRAIANMVASSRANVADEQLTRLIESVVTDIPSDAKQPPSARFNAAVELYRQIKSSTNPGAASLYFKGDAVHLMDTYLANYQGAGVDNTTAYQSAYKAISPEAKAAVEQRLKDPAVVSKIHSEARGAVTTWYQRLWASSVVPFTDSIDSTLVEQGAEQEARRYLSINPQADNKTLNTHLEQWSQENFYRDTNTNSFVRIPPAMNNAGTQKAISNYLDTLVKAHNKGDQDRAPRLQWVGEDQYEVWLSKPGVGQLLGRVSLHDINALEFATTNVNAEERAELGRIKQGITKGTITPEELRQAKPLLDKARSAGMWQSSDAESRVMMKDDPGVSPLYTSMTAPMKDGWKPTTVVRPDSSVTRDVVSQYVTGGSPGAALTAMAEGVRLTAYNDPAIGRNIGIGYNMDKNAKTLNEDFRRAGIPANSIEGVVNGTVSITPQQAMRLYEVVRPRYEDMAKRAVEQRAPGEWKKMPANAREVLIDMAYQAGNKVGGFTKGLDALIKGDLSGAGLETTFVDRKTGQRRVDERRHTLRTALLSSTTNFQTVINHATKLPANAYEARVALR